MFELQEWTGRHYNTVAHFDTARAAESALEAPANRLRQRRLVLTSKARDCKPGKPPGARRRTAAPGMSDTETIAAYFAWAEARGLESVTVYGDTRRGTNGHFLVGLAQRYAKAMGLAVRTVPLADILGPAPAAEVES